MYNNCIKTATEAELLLLINNYIDPEFESIVADEELGNQVWVVTVYDEPMDKDTLNEPYYKTRDYLNELCHQGHIPAGEYNVDCTW